MGDAAGSLVVTGDVVGVFSETFAVYSRTCISRSLWSHGIVGPTNLMLPMLLFTEFSGRIASLAGEGATWVRSERLWTSIVPSQRY